jgi:hypothetical protein
VSDPVRTPHNFTPGAIAFQLTGSAALGAALQVAATAAVIGAVLAAVRWSTPEASYLAVVVASQLLSPTLWDHYAVLLLLPVAWLLERRVWLAAVVPLSTSLALVWLTPPATYPLLFAVVLAAVVAVGARERRWPA